MSAVKGRWSDAVGAKQLPWTRTSATSVEPSKKMRSMPWLLLVDFNRAIVICALALSVSALGPSVGI